MISERTHRLLTLSIHDNEFDFIIKSFIYTDLPKITCTREELRYLKCEISNSENALHYLWWLGLAATVTDENFESIKHSYTYGLALLSLPLVKLDKSSSLYLRTNDNNESAFIIDSISAFEE